MIARAIFACIVIGGIAFADPPTGYRCGDGKPNPGKGCTCPSGFAEKRESDGTATCAAATSGGTAANPCEVLAERVAALWGGTGAARERRLVFDSCTHDRWSGEALHCEREKTREKLTACLKGKLTGDQEKTFEAARDAMFERIEAEVGVSDKAIGKRFVLFVGRTAKLDDMATIWISAIADKMLALKDIDQVEIQSHVDNAGSADAARKLTQQRADVVRDALVKLGVVKERLVAKGYGMERPIAANSTEAGRAQNNRIEFVIAKRATAVPKQSDADLAKQANEDGKQAMYAGKYAEASKKFRDAIAHGPSPVIYFNLCTSLFQEGKFGEALGACNSADSGADASLKPRIAKLTARIRDEAKKQNLQVEPPH